MDDRTGRVLIPLRIALFGVASAAVLATLSCSGSSHPGGTTGSASGSVPVSAAASGASSAPTSSAAPVPGSSPSTVPVVVPTGTVAPYPTPTRGDAPNPDQAKVLNSLPGSGAANTCVAVGAHTTLRSGSIAAGNFVTARRSFSAQYRKTELPELTMYVIPQHAAHLTRASVSVFARSTGTTKTATSESVQTGDTAQYFVIQVPVVGPGGYRLTMTSGADHGCFLVSFGQ